MTSPPLSGGHAGTLQQLRRAVSDTSVIVGRNLIVLRRMPVLIVFATVQPILFVLLFRYVFGGAIETGGDYVDFLMPGIFVQTVTFGAIQTGIGLADDAGSGLIDRLRTLPMSRSALLTGRTVSDLIRNIGVLMLMVLVGTLVGFRLGGTVAAAVAAMALVLLWSFAISWMAAFVGLRVADAESAQATMFPLLFPLTFASSAFVPVSSMPGWLATFADNQPLSATVDAARALLLGTPLSATGLMAALLWPVVVIAVFAPLAVRVYRQR